MWPLFDLDEQYQRYPHIKRKNVQQLLQWTHSQAHLPKLSEHEVILFYNACKCNMEYSKQVIEANYTFRTHNDEFFGDMDVERAEMKLVQQTLMIVPLIQRTPEGYAVLMSKIIDTNPSNFNLCNCINFTLASAEMWLMETGVLPGITIVIDLNGVSFGHIAHISLFKVKKAVYFLQEAMAVSVVGIHFINAGVIIDKIMSILSLFLKKEVLQNVHTHTSMETFYEFVPREMFPQDYEGGLEIASNVIKDNFYQKVQTNRLAIIEHSNQRRVNEKLRSRNQTNSKFNFLKGKLFAYN